MSGWSGQTVLVVSPTPTAPVDFGNRRYILNSFKRLQAHGARIVFLYYPAEHDWRDQVPADHLRVMQEQWDEFYLAPVSRPLHANPQGDHHDIDEWWDESLGPLLRWIFQTHRIDVCVVNYTWLTGVFNHCPPGVLKIIDTHDRFAGRKELFLDNGIAPEFFYLTEEAERRALQRADVIWAIKPDEARYFHTLTRLPALTFPHVEQAELAYRCRVPREKLLRFGFFAARNEINRSNYCRFFEMLDVVARRWLLPARFVLAGSLCDVIAAGDFPFVERLGRVESVEEFYNACDVVVVPMNFSTGLKIKVGEALGYAKALIAHAHAFDGYHATHRFHACDGFEQICTAIVEVIDTPELVDELEIAALRSSREADQRAEQCVLETLGPSPTSPRFLVLAPADLLRLAQVVDHIAEACAYIGYIERPTVYVTGDARQVPTAVWSRLSRHARLVAEPLGDMAVQDSPTFGGVSFLRPEQFRGEGADVLYALRCDDAFVAWQVVAQDCVLRLEDWGPEPGIELARSAACLRAMPAAVRVGIVTLGSVAAEAGLRQRGVDLRHVRVPLLREGRTSTLLPVLRDLPRAGICVLGIGTNPAVLRAVVGSPAFRRRWGGQPCHLVLSEAEQALCPYDDHLVWFRRLSPETMVQSFQTDRQVPALFVQLHPDPAAYAWLHELCGRAMLPFVSLTGAFGDGAAANLSGTGTPALPGLRARQALNVLDAVYSQNFIETEKAALIKAWPYGSDSGWAWLWRLVKWRIAA